MKDLIKVALISGGLLGSGSVFAGFSLDEIMQKYYPSYDSNEDCRTYSRMNKYDNGNQEEYIYCVNFSSEKKVNINGDEYLYVATSGYNMNSSAGWADALAGMFVLKSDGNGWIVKSAKPYISAGVNGESIQQWSFHEFAPNIYGFLGNHGYGMNGGTSLESFVILTPNGKTIIDNDIGSFLNTEATMSCGKKCDDARATIRIDKSKVVNGFYPLVLTVNGRVNGKMYKNQEYRINYEANKGYIMPQNYPFNNLRF